MHEVQAVAIDKVGLKWRSCCGSTTIRSGLFRYVGAASIVAYILFRAAGCQVWSLLSSFLFQPCSLSLSPLRHAFSFFLLHYPSYRNLDSYGKISRPSRQVQHYCPGWAAFTICQLRVCGSSSRNGQISTVLSIVCSPCDAWQSSHRLSLAFY